MESGSVFGIFRNRIRFRLRFQRFWSIAFLEVAGGDISKSLYESASFWLSYPCGDWLRNVATHFNINVFGIGFWKQAPYFASASDRLRTQTSFRHFRHDLAPRLHLIVPNIPAFVRNVSLEVFAFVYFQLLSTTMKNQQRSHFHLLRKTLIESIRLTPYGARTWLL